MIETIAIEGSDGVMTGARRKGAHGPALIFVHGVGSTAAIWDTQLHAFGDRFRCYAIELRGNGVTTPEPDPSAITREGFARDVLAVVDAAHVDRFTIVGCSLGGVVAFELWKATSQRIEAMAVVGSFAHYPNAQVYADSIKTAVREAGDMSAFAAQRAARLALRPERLRETIDQMSCKDSTSYIASTQATWTGDYRAMLSTIDVPVLITCGENDLIAPLALSQELHHGIARSQMAVIEHAGHVANADAPEAFNGLLRDFLATVYVA